MLALVLEMHVNPFFNRIQTSNNSHQKIVISFLYDAFSLYNGLGDGILSISSSIDTEFQPTCDWDILQENCRGQKKKGWEDENQKQTKNSNDALRSDRITTCIKLSFYNSSPSVNHKGIGITMSCASSIQ